MNAADPGPFDDISVSKAGAVIEVMLNRPDRLNPISARVGGTRDQIVQAITAAEDDPEIGCVLLLGAGRAFSAGGDVIGNEPRETPAEQIAFLEMSEACHRRLRAARLPLIAAVHGYCLGAAMSLVASCDLVIAAASARFGLPEGRMGLIGASALVPIVGRQWTKFLIFTGELIDAEAARELGLVLSVEPDELMLERARDLAGRLSRMPREAVLLNKRTVDAVADASGDAAGRIAALGYDAVTLTNGARAKAPDGRSFRDIVATEGIDGMKAAQVAQYREPWLGRSPVRGDSN